MLSNAGSHVRVVYAHREVHRLKGGLFRFTADGKKSYFLDAHNFGAIAAMEIGFIGIVTTRDNRASVYGLIRTDISVGAEK